MMEYDRDGIRIRGTTVADLRYLAVNLRSDDIKEMWASHHIDPVNALVFCFNKSPFCYTVERDKRPVVIFGIFPISVLGNEASVWMLSTDELMLIKRRFVRHSRKIIEHMLSFYPILYNYVDVRNKESVKWLRWCGAKMETAMPYGVDQLPFHRFSFGRK